MRHYRPDTAIRLNTLLVLAHGAGAGQLHPFMVRYARGLAARGLDVFTFDFPYIEAKRRTPDRAPVLEESFLRVIGQAAAAAGAAAGRLLIGGKSMGGRIATHLAAAPDRWPPGAPPLAGVVVLGYPLRPPGGGSRTDRVSHLFDIHVPTLIVQGTRDSFGGPADIRAALQGRQPPVAIHEVDGGDHSFAVPKAAGKTQMEVDTQIWDAILSWSRGKP
jgi:predicted alpha/beta-hydrolase family hydrolase